MKRAVPFYRVIPYEEGDGAARADQTDLADRMDLSELLIKNHSQPYVKFILYKREVLIKLHFIGKIIGLQGGTLSGIVEPIGAIITIALTRIVVPILPYFLSFAAGAMIYVVSSELIPEAQAEKKSNLVTISVGIGFVIMMLLDVALG